MKPWQKWHGLIAIVILFAACQQSDDAGEASDGENNTNDDAEEVSEDTSTDADEEETPAIPVETSTATRGDIAASYSGTAAVEALQDALVVAKVGGEVRELLVEEGDTVTAGRILARLDGDRLRLEQRQTEANLRKLEREYQRNVDLKQRGLLSDGDFDKIQFEMEALGASNDLAKLQLSYASIRAPIDGVISQRFINIGNTVEIDAQLFQVTSLEPLVSYLHVPEREYRKLQAGQDATMAIDALGGAIFAATVARISPVVDSETGTFKTTIEVFDESRRLKPGMFARIGIVYDLHSNVLQVPRGALIDEAGSTSIFVVDGDIANRRTVTTGFSNDGLIEITDGLGDAEKFVVIGQSGLRDGSKVVVINDENVPTGTASAND